MPLKSNILSQQETFLTADMKKIIRKQRIINCSLPAAWQKWTTREGLLSFFGKDNKIELKIGGPYEIYMLMDNPPGLRGTEGCKVLSFLPESMLSCTWNAPPHFPNIRNSDYHTWIVVNFKSVDQHKTEVEINHLGWPDYEEWNKVFEYFVGAWELVLNWLEDSCKK
jgi:uncharacterized protein YndB with AHSA1/START domain